jgi:hypothetical protein
MLTKYLNVCLFVLFLSVNWTLPPGLELHVHSPAVPSSWTLNCSQKSVLHQIASVNGQRRIKPGWFPCRRIRRSSRGKGAIGQKGGTEFSFATRVIDSRLPRDHTGMSAQKVEEMLSWPRTVRLGECCDSSARFGLGTSKRSSRVPKRQIKRSMYA